MRASILTREKSVDSACAGYGKQEMSYRYLYNE